MIVYKPKEDFEKSIKIQEQYVQLLKEYHAQLMIKRQKANAFMKSKLAVELHELSSKLDLQVELLNEKANHYMNHFLPKYNKELEICERDFDKVFKKGKSKLTSLKGEIAQKLNYAISAYEQLDDVNKKHIEVKNVVFKDIKTLLSL
jgi:hypothetical protein